MPRTNGMGPMGCGPLTGRGLGPCGGGVAANRGAGFGQQMGFGYRHGLRSGYCVGFAPQFASDKTRDELLAEQKAFLEKRIEYIDSLMKKPE